MRPDNLRTRAHFSAEALGFLHQLRRNNNRPWFQAHKETYERALRQPMQDLVLQIAEAFHRFAPEIIADPKASIYRIYRDTRFSKDKKPYKDHIAAIFPVRGLPKNSAPGFYFRLTEEEVLIAGGAYVPDAPQLRVVRERIAANPRGFVRIVEAKNFRDAFGELEGEQLRSMPKGFSADHPAANYLRYKQFLFAQQHPAKLACSPRLLPIMLDCFKKGMPLIRFLGEAALQAASSAASSGTIPSTRLPLSLSPIEKSYRKPRQTKRGA